MKNLNRSREREREDLRSELDRERRLRREAEDSLRIARRSMKKRALFLTLLFGLPLITGLNLILTNFQEVTSALASFFVTDPIKGVNIDRGNFVIESSQVNVYDEEADNGYLVKARLDPLVDANFSVAIWSASSGLCTQASPCYLSTADTVVHANVTDSATEDNTSTGGTKGDVIDFDVRIFAGMGLGTGVHDVDIIYTKERRVKTMQSFETAMCTEMPLYPLVGGEVDLIDARDGKQYKIRKLADNNCWMVDNLALRPTGASMVLDSATSDIASGTFTLAVASVIDPHVASPSYCTDRLSGSVVDNKGVAYAHGCGMQYNWTTATIGSTLSSGTAPDSICPKNWRLPANTSGDFATLQTALNWSTSGANVNNSTWRGLYVGGYGGTSEQGTSGYYLSATAASAGNPYYLNYASTIVRPSWSNNPKTQPYSVRCLAR